MMVSGESARSYIGTSSESSATTRCLKVSVPRIGDDPERDGADARVNGAEVVLSTRRDR